MKLAVIGLGIGRVHAMVMANLSEVELVGVCDLDQSKAEEVAQAAGTAAYTDWREMLDAASPEGVSLCTNPASHLPIGQELAERGIHVLCEKPMAPTVEQCLALSNTCDEAGVTLMVAQKKRFAPAMRFLREHIGADFGQPRCLNYRFHPGQVPKDWFWSEDDGGGPILENAVHVFDTLRFLAGEITAIRGIGGNFFNLERVPQIDVALGLLEFESGCMGAVELGTASEWAMADEELFLACDDAVARSRGGFDRPNEVLYTYREQGHPRTFAVDYEGDMATRDFGTEIAEFVEAATTNSRPPVTGWEAARSVACCLAMKQAVRENRVVPVAWRSIAP